MSKTMYLFASAVAVCLVTGCAHTNETTARKEKGSAIRLDPAIRTACGDNAVDAFFPYDSNALTPVAEARLSGLASCLNTGALKGKNVSITGYTDPSGSAEYNKQLGKERADSVASYLGSKGVETSRMTVNSKGEAGASPNPENWEWDRMVDISLN